MSLIAWYKLDQDTLDSVGLNHGTIIGLNYTYELGKIDYAFKTTSNDTRISTPLKLLTEDGKPFSISFWCKKITDWVTSSAFMGERISYTWMFYRSDTWVDGRFSFLVYYLDTSDVYTYNHLYVTLPSLDVWHHLVLTLNGATRRIYLNGVLAGTSIITNLKTYRVESSTRFGIASQSANSGSYPLVDGSIDDVRVFDHELSLKEVKELYRAKVLHLKLDEQPDDCAYGNVGIPSNIVYSYDSKLGNACIENTDGSSRYIDIGIKPRITGDQTICMWLYPIYDGARQNPYNKTYGGEGTITFEVSRTLNYYWGTNGGNASPYTGFNSSTSLSLNAWSHVAISRNITNNTLTWYINGVQTAQTTCAYSASAASTMNLIIGTGYTNPFRGKIDDVRVYASGLNSNDILEIMNVRGKLDSIGNFYINELKETGYKPLLVNYREWVVGTSGSQGNFIRNGDATENYIIEDTDPWGRIVPVWEARPDSVSGPDGGWNYTKYGVIDPTKLYRFSVYVRRTITGNGYFYFGCLGNGVRRLSSGSLDGNPYFWYSNTNVTSELGWILVIGYILPYDTTYTTDNKYLDSGRWRISDKSFLGNINFNFKWAESTTTDFVHRSYLYYSTDTSTRQQWVYPRVDLVDGTEPSLQDLLNGFDSYNWEYLKNIDTTKYLPLSISNKRIYISNPNELGPVNGMIAYWKFEDNILDFGQFGYHGTSTDVSFVTGVDGNCAKFNGTTSTTSMGDVLNIGYDDRSYSCWVKFLSGEGSGLGQVICSKTDNSTTPCRHCFGTDTSDRMYAWMTGNPNSNQYSTVSGASRNPCDGNWHHVAVTFNRGGNLTLYLDGQIEGTPVDISPEKNTNMVIARPFRIGSYNNASNSPILFTNGLIDDFRVYNRVLTENEVNILYNLYQPSTNKRMILENKGKVYVKNNFKEV